MKREKNQLFPKMNKKRVNSLTKKPRDLTPDLKIRQKINFLSSENILSISNTNQSLSFLKPEQKRIRSRIISSYSPNDRKIKNSSNNLVFSLIKNRSISKRIINNCRKNISNLKKNFGFNSPRSKTKKLKKKFAPPQKKSQPPLLNSIPQFHVNTFQSNDTINSNYTLSNTNNYNNIQTCSFNHFGQLTDFEVKSLSMIQTLIQNVVGKSQNKAAILNELDIIYKNVFHEYNSSMNNGNKSSNNSDNNIHSNSSANNNTTDDSNNNIFNKLDAINSKCEYIQAENSKLKKLIPEKSETFEDVKESIKNFKEEINKIKKNTSTTIPTNKNQKHNNNNINNKPKFPLKNVSLNLQLVQKVKNLDKGIYSDSQRNNINSRSNDTIINTNENVDQSLKMNDLNLKKIPNNTIHDFNQEFLENYNDFSPSWRREVDKMNQRRKDYQII